MKNIVAPKLSNTNQYEVVDALELYNEAIFRQVHIKDALIVDFSGLSVGFDDVVFEDVVFENIKIRSFDCIDVRFVRCQFVNCEFIGSFWKRVHFDHCKVMATNFSESKMESILYSDSLIDMGSYYFANLKFFGFKNTVLRRTDFYEDTIKSFYFDTCELLEVDFSKTSLKGIDFRTSKLIDLKVTQDSLAGCVVTSEQALGLATLLGIEIKETWE